MPPARPPPPRQQPGAPEAAAHRRPKAPHKSPRCAWRRETASGGEGHRAALPRRQPAPGREAARAARGQRTEGCPALTMGCRYYLITQIPRQKGLGGGIRPLCRLPRMRGGAGEGGGSGDWRSPPCSVPLPARRGAGRCPPARRPRLAPAGGGEMSPCGGESLLTSSLRSKKEGRHPARRPFWRSPLPQGGGGCFSRLMAAGAPRRGCPA